MKTRIYLALGMVAALAVLLWWLWPKHSMQPVKTEQPNKSTALPAPAAATATASRPPTGENITAEDLARIPGPGTDEEKHSRIVELRQIMNQANQPVDFWGMVIDQDGAPLPGVKVKLSLKHTREILPGSTRDVFEYHDMVTDIQGMFSLTDRRGSLLGVDDMKKEGYEAPNFGSRAYWFAPPIVTMQYTSDKAKPEVFRMWKKIGAEKLVNKSVGTGIPYDGTSVNFDLLTGQEVTSGGDVRVTLARTPLQIKRGQQKYDWTATIEAIDGGVIASNDEFMYRAPETGYEPKLTIAMAAKDPKWSAQKSVSFYLKSHGKYGRVKADFATDYDRPKTGFNLQAFINPSGSRNLEYDPMQNVVNSSPTSKP